MIGKETTNISYNLLNLPYKIKKGDAVIDIQYLADGSKLSYKDENGDTRLYLGSFELVNGEIEIIKHENGYLRKEEDDYRAQYYLKDYLGNIVVLFEDKDGDGTITSETQAEADIEVLQRMIYYPFGMESVGTYFNMEDSEAATTRYKYTGKEFHSFTDMYDYGARWYLPSIGRWMGVDPLAEEMPGWSSYSYTFNNPLKYTDPDGRIPAPIIGFGLDVASQMIFEGKSFNEVNYGSAAVSGLAGMASGGVSSVRNFGKAGQLVMNTMVDTGESVGKQIISKENISGAQILSDVTMGGIGRKAKVFDDASIKVKRRTLDRAQRIAKNDPNSSGRAQNVANAQKSLNFTNRTNDATGTAAENTLQAGSRKVKSFLNTGDGPGSIIQSKDQITRDNTRVVNPIFDSKLN